MVRKQCMTCLPTAKKEKITEGTKLKAYKRWTSQRKVEKVIKVSFFQWTMYLHTPKHTHTQSLPFHSFPV